MLSLTLFCLVSVGSRGGGWDVGTLVVIVPDAFTEELESFIRKLYCPIMSIPLGQNLMVADEMFSDGPGAGVKA